MRFLGGTLLFGIAVLMTGCVPSLHPLYTKEDVFIEPALVGTWVTNDESEIWRFEISGDGYQLSHSVRKSRPPEDGNREAEQFETAEFEARLVRIGNYLFIDLFPEEPEIEDDLYKIHLLPVHTILRVWLEGDALSMAMLDHDWLKKEIEGGRIRIAHEPWDDGKSILLTASSKELQGLVAQYAEDRNAFPEPEEPLRRRR